jgi:hypothetical protein
MVSSCKPYFQGTELLFASILNLYIVLEHPATDASLILKLVLKKEVGRMWTGFIWLRIGTSGWLL